MSACEICQKLVLEPARRMDGPANYRAMDYRWRSMHIHDVCSAAVNGCSACLMLADGISRLRGSFDSIETIELFSPVARIGPLYLCISALADASYSSKELASKTGFEVYTLKSAPAIWPVVGPARNLSLDSSSDECFSLAKGWIENCINNHPNCYVPSATPLPTRVIRVSSEGVDPCLYVTHQEDARYAALSHCWGKKGMITTTEATFEQRKRRIAWADLPKTFQDAIIITRRIGLEYLWIDSICIVQDSKADWAAEAARMAAVYENALITIAAEDSPDSQGGCFLKGDRQKRRDIQLECSGVDGHASQVYVRKLGFRLNRGLAHVTGEQEQGKLSSRAWALQERLLSPRLLLYTVSELVWECSTQVSCECQLYSEEPSYLYKPEYLTLSKRAKTEPAIKITPSVGGAQWYHTIGDFSRRDLTYSSDRLPALAGLAAALQRITGATYAAGLWKEDIAAGLAWGVVAPGELGCITASRRHPEYYAPSWSWASVTGRVECESLDRNWTVDIKVLELSCLPAGPNAFGPVRSAHLRINGLVLPVWIDHKSYPNGGQYHNKLQLAISRVYWHLLHLLSKFRLLKPQYAKFTSKLQQTKEKLHFQANRLDAMGRDVIEVFFHPDVQGDGYEICASEPHFLLAVRHGWTYQEGTVMVQYLVLRRSRVNSSAFERVGYLYNDNYSWDHWCRFAKRRTLTIV